MRIRIVSSTLLLMLAAGCGAYTCVDVHSDCAPLYAPTWDNVYEQTIVPSCATAGAGCHAGEGAQGDLVLEAKAEAYRQLVDGQEPRVLAGDAGCSLLVIRIEHSNGDRVMPPGLQMSEEERCAIRQWVEQGAQE